MLQAMTKNEKKISEVRLGLYSYFELPEEYCFILKPDGTSLVTKYGIAGKTPEQRQEYSVKKTQEILQCFSDIRMIHWKHKYCDPDIMDGTSWELTVKFTNGKKSKYYGVNAYPENWEVLVDLF